MEKEDKRLIRFDWAIKRLLRQKADYIILEGFLSSLLGRKITILKILESESNREYEENKQNRVDLLAEEVDGSKILIEVQNESEDAYFHRMLFGTSRVISEYLQSGENYDKITKIYNINIVYFNLGEGNDYVYHGTTEFRGIHTKEVLRLSDHLKRKYKVEEIRDIFPEYYILRANDFDKWSRTPLDQWMYFLSKSEIPEDADAPGLKEASEQLRVSGLTKEERNEYMHHMREMNSLRDMFSSTRERALFEGRQEGLEEGRREGLEEGRKKGIKEGLEEGRKEGLEEGRKKGIKEGLEEGRKKGIKEGLEEGRREGIKEGLEEGRREGIKKGLEEGRREGIKEGLEEGLELSKKKIARNLLGLGLPIDEISSATGLSIEEISKL